MSIGFPFASRSKGCGLESYWKCQEQNFKKLLVLGNIWLIVFRKRHEMYLGTTSVLHGHQSNAQ